MSLVEKTKISIYGLQVLIAEDYSSKQEIEEKVKAKISNLQLLDDDDEAKESIKLLQSFLKDCVEQGKKINKLELKESIYEDALRKSNSPHSREFILQKLQNIDTDKTKFL
jgi:hypothetical protein